MCKQGCLEGIDEVYGLHNLPNFTAGQVRVISGPIFASSTTVRITVHGRGGHGSSPHLSRDPINAAAYMLTNLLQIKSRYIDSRENVVFNICNIESGSADNVLPDKCFF